MTFVMWATGIVFVLFFFVVFIYPAFLGIIQGECWGVNTHNTIKAIKSEFKSVTVGGEGKKIGVIIGDCVDNIAFVDEDTLKEFYLNYFIPADADQLFKCPDGYGVYMIAIPYFEETKSGLAFWKWYKDLIKEEIEKVYKEKFKGIKPICDILDTCEKCHYNGPIEQRVLSGSRKRGESRKYCITMKKLTDENFNISVSEGGC